jgi:hypothetical protein
MTHYESVENCDKLWATGGGDPDVIEAALPWLLALLTFIAEFLCKQGGTCLLHKLQNYIRDHIDLGDFISLLTNGSSCLIGALQRHRNMMEPVCSTLARRSQLFARIKVSGMVRALPPEHARPCKHHSDGSTSARGGR